MHTSHYLYLDLIFLPTNDILGFSIYAYNMQSKTNFTHTKRYRMSVGMQIWNRLYPYRYKEPVNNDIGITDPHSTYYQMIISIVLWRLVSLKCRSTLQLYKYLLKAMGNRLVTRNVSNDFWRLLSTRTSVFVSFPYHTYRRVTNIYKIKTVRSNFYTTFHYLHSMLFMNIGMINKTQYI